MLKFFATRIAPSFTSVQLESTHVDDVMIEAKAYCVRFNLNILLSYREENSVKMTRYALIHVDENTDETTTLFL